MNHKQNKKKGFQPSRMRCPYCGAPVIFRSAEGIYKTSHLDTMLYVCSKYPKCDAYVRVHAGTKIPVGSLANKELRDLRRTLHMPVLINEDLGFDSEAKEAVAFAILANECVHGLCNNVPSVTGARHPVVMGKISL